MDRAKRILRLMDKIKRELDTLTKREAEVTTAIAQLTAKGCQDFKEYWTGKEKAYMYKLFPMTDGKRRKEYVGNQQYKIDEARMKKSNHERREELKVQLFKITDRINEIHSNLESAAGGYFDLFDIIGNESYDADINNLNNL